MRRSIAASVLALLTVAWAATATTPPARADIDVDVSFGFFYSNLGRHGDWEFSANYGEVWCPREAYAGWHPYMDGHWVYTDVGWAWVSDYSWGGIPYHYGTWTVDPGLGWVWVPGYIWAPSWVVFRTGGDYIGWAPVSPSFSIGVSFGSPSFDAFLYVPVHGFASTRIRDYVVPSSRVRTIYSQTRLINSIRLEGDIVVNKGLDPTFIERRAGARIRRDRIENVRHAGPERRFNRDSVRVDRRRGLRAAEPRREQQMRQGRPRPDEPGRPRSDDDRARPRDDQRGRPQDDDRNQPRYQERGRPQDEERGQPRTQPRGNPPPDERGRPRAEERDRQRDEEQGSRPRYDSRGRPTSERDDSDRGKSSSRRSKAKAKPKPKPEPKPDND